MDEPDRPPRSSALAIGIFLLGLFAFGYNAATALHEGGHAVVGFFTGGKPRHLMLEPLSTSSVEVWPDPHPLATYAGGIVLASAIGFGLVALAERARGVTAALVRATGLASLATNAIYLLVGTWTGTGDASVLQQLGAPPSLLAGLGILLAGAATVLTARGLPALGISGEASTWRRFVLLVLGIAPYLGAMVGYHLRRDVGELPLWGAFAGVGILVLAAVAALASSLESRYARSRVREYAPTLPAILVALSLGTGAVLLELWWF